jgi:hypothetical protein
MEGRLTALAAEIAETVGLGGAERAARDREHDGLRAGELRAAAR